MPRLIAATAEGNTASATPFTLCATATGQNPGASAIATAAPATATPDTAISVRFQGTASTSAPAGPRASTVAMPPMVSTRPVEPASQCCADTR